MLEVWGRKNSSQIIQVMWTVGELGLEHVRHNLGGSFGGLDTQEYGRMNPNRKVPTINDNGFVLWESYAIIRYLSRQYGTGSLWPDDPHQVALADQWMEWSQETVSILFPVFWALVRTPLDKRDPEKIAASARATAKALAILDQHLEGQQFVVGDNFTMGDIPLGAAAFKYFSLPIERPSLPNVEAWYARLRERPAYQAHAMNPFGSSPEEWLALEKAGA